MSKLNFSEDTEKIFAKLRNRPDYSELNGFKSPITVYEKWKEAKVLDAVHEQTCELGIAVDRDRMEEILKESVNHYEEGYRSGCRYCIDIFTRLLSEVAKEYPYMVCGEPETYLQYNEGWTDALFRVDALLNGEGLDQ